MFLFIFYHFYFNLKTKYSNYFPQKTSHNEVIKRLVNFKINKMFPLHIPVKKTETNDRGDPLR
jgi:hypothetical protein